MMKHSTLLTNLAVSAAVLSACALPASAAVLNPQNDSEKKAYVVDLKQSAEKWREITGVKITVTPAEDWKSEGGFGGGVIFSGSGVPWDANKKEFSISGEGMADKKDQLSSKKDGGSFVLTYDNKSPLFKNAGSGDECWAKLTVQDWWGADFSVDKVEYLYAENSAEPAAETTTASSAAVTTTSACVTTASSAASSVTAKTSTTTAPAARTGDAGAGLAMAGLALAGTAAFAVRRKR
jgi:hypothetical protein